MNTCPPFHLVGLMCLLMFLMFSLTYMSHPMAQGPAKAANALNASEL